MTQSFYEILCVDILQNEKDFTPPLSIVYFDGLEPHLSLFQCFICKSANMQRVFHESA